VRTTLRLAVALFAFAASIAMRAPHASTQAANDAIRPFEARYEVWRNGKLAGEARLALLSLGSRHELTTRTRGTRGLAALAHLEIDERSVFVWRDGAPELMESSYDQRAAWTSRKRSLRVDRASNTIASYDGKRLHTLAFAPHTIDVHLTTLALMARLRSNAHAPLDFNVATRDEIEHQRYERVGNASVVTPAGTYPALHIRRVRSTRERVSESWLAPALGYLPVQIRYDDSKGERIELRLVSRTERAR